MARYQPYGRPVSMNLLSNRTCGFPAYGLTMIFLVRRAWRLHPRRDPAFPRGVTPAVTAFAESCRWSRTWHAPIAGPRSCRAFTKGVLAVSGMPSRLPPGRRDQSRVPSLQRVVIHAFLGTTNPSDSLLAPCDFSRPALYARSLPDMAAREGLSCSALLCPNVPPPETPKRSSIRSGPECCLLPSPRHDRLGPLEHLSADNLTRLQRSPIVAARWFAPLCCKGFRHSARPTRISPLGWSLLPGAPALTRTGLAPARSTRLSGRTTPSA
jgi:hypothetical protein